MCWDLCYHKVYTTPHGCLLYYNVRQTKMLTVVFTWHKMPKFWYFPCVTVKMQLQFRHGYVLWYLIHDRICGKQSPGSLASRLELWERKIHILKITFVWLKHFENCSIDSVLILFTLRLFKVCALWLTKTKFTLIYIVGIENKSCGT